MAEKALRVRTNSEPQHSPVVPDDRDIVEQGVGRGDCDTGPHGHQE